MQTCEPAKFRLLVIGRLSGVTRKRLRVLVEQAGGELASRPSLGVDLVALSHRSASMVLQGLVPLGLPRGLAPAVKVISEIGLKRMLRLAPETPEEDRTLDRPDVLRASKLSPELLDCLEAYDVVEPHHGAYSYHDVMVAREMRRLLNRGHDLCAIVQASLSLRRSSASLADVRVVEAPWGEVLQQTCEGIASLDGQLALPLPHEASDPDDVFERAEVAEASGDPSGAERLYRRLMEMDRTDAAIPYNLANLLDAQGRRREAVVAYYEALRRDRTFAEAWFNLGVLEQEEGRAPEAVAHYRAALLVQPNFSDAVFNLALVLTDQEVYVEAALLWERFIDLHPHGSDAARARRYAALCRVGQSRSRQMSAAGLTQT